jgi:hypothetical protein
MENLAQSSAKEAEQAVEAARFSGHLDGWVCCLFKDGSVEKVLNTLRSYLIRTVSAVSNSAMNYGSIVFALPQSTKVEAAQRWLLTGEGPAPGVHALAHTVNAHDRMTDWDKINLWLEDMISLSLFPRSPLRLTVASVGPLGTLAITMVLQFLSHSRRKV